MYKETPNIENSKSSFVGSWLKNPAITGAIAPSSDALADKMASFVDPNGLPVLELGPGTGAMTRALLRRGVAPEKIIALEFDDNFCAHFQASFPYIRLIQGDAYQLSNTLNENLSDVPRFGAIVSSLPLLNRPLEDRERVLKEGLDHLHEKAPFIQFSYGLRAPVKAPPTAKLKRTSWILRNIPPARVYVYRAI